jgi:hypothetical protein
MARRVALASSYAPPVSAITQAAARAASSIVTSACSSSSRRSQRAATRGCRCGSFRATSTVSSSVSTRLSCERSLAAQSSESTFPRASARRKIAYGWPCEVDAPPPSGPGGRRNYLNPRPRLRRRGHPIAPLVSSIRGDGHAASLYTPRTTAQPAGFASAPTAMSKAMRKIPQPSGAVAEMLEQDGELDRILSGRGLVFDNPPAPTWNRRRRS